MLVCVCVYYNYYNEPITAYNLPFRKKKKKQKSQLHWIYLISKAPSGGISKIFRASKTSCGRLGCQPLMLQSLLQFGRPKHRLLTTYLSGMILQVADNLNHLNDSSDCELGLLLRESCSFFTDITSTISETDLNTLGAFPRTVHSLILHHLSNAMENMFKTYICSLILHHSFSMEHLKNVWDSECPVIARQFFKIQTIVLEGTN